MRLPLIYGTVLTLLTGAALAQEASPLGIRKPVSRELAGFETHDYFIAMQAGQSATILFRNRGIDFTARLLAPDGAEIIDFAVPQGLGDEETDAVVAERTGMYRLRIKAPYRQPAGRYEVRLDDVRQATERDRRLHQALALGSEARQLNAAAEYVKALPRAARAVEILEKELGPRNATVAGWTSLLGTLQFLTGNYEMSEALLRQALEIQEKVCGPDHPQTVATMGSLGSTYLRAGEYARAESLLSQAFERATKPGGKERPETILCLRNLARLHHARGDSARAETSCNAPWPSANAFWNQTRH